jgi:hypothetical protein
MLPSCPPEALSEPRKKMVSSFEKVLVSADNEWSGDTEEGKVGSDWIEIGSLVSEVMDILEYVFVGIRIGRSSEDEEFSEGCS